MTCIVTATETKLDNSYLGWANYETWNISLWLCNDAGLYELAKQYRRMGYANLSVTLQAFGIYETPDGVSYTDEALDIDALDEMLEDI